MTQTVPLNCLPVAKTLLQTDTVRPNSVL